MSSSDATERERAVIADRSREAASRASPGDILADRFVLREILGAGATGTVFSALDRSVGQKVAIKVLHPDLHDERTRERLRREVRASRNGHPNAISVFDLHEADNQVFLSMELVEGRSLRGLLRERGTLETAEVVAIGGQIAGALASLHRKGIIHRDIKPGNILITDDGTAKLCDMGLARPLVEGMTVTETEAVVGTPAYMAPEQGLGGRLTAASDIYGLGLTLWRCLTGSVPLTSDTAVATLTRRQRERPPAVRSERPDCPRWLDRLIRQMLEPMPGDRPSAPRVENAMSLKRAWPLPRRRTVVRIFALLAIATASVVGVPYFLGPETVDFEVDGGSAHGIAADGRRTWTYALPAPSIRAIETDLDGDGRVELVVAGRAIEESSVRSPERAESYVVVLDHRGSVLTTLVPEKTVTSWNFPFRKELNALPFAIDVDGDGRQELLVLCQHLRFYPSAVILYWPVWDRWEMTLVHPGHLATFAAGTGKGTPGLRFLGVNNTLGMTPVYGEIALNPPGVRLAHAGMTSSLAAAPLTRMDPSTVGSWETYVPLDEASGGWVRAGERIRVHADGAVDIGNPPPRFRLDRYSNPVPGPNQGGDLRAQRLAFMTSMYSLNPGSGALTPTGVTDLIDRTRNSAGPLMAEAPYRIILAVVGARALASTGDLDSALALLESTTRTDDDEDLLYLQGHLQAISGDLTSAHATVTRLINGTLTSRSHYDGILLLLKIAASAHDRKTAAGVIDLAGRNGDQFEEQRTHWNSLWARARLWWDESTLADCNTSSTQLDGDGDAVGCLARWRLGRTKIDDVETMESSVEVNPDGAGFGRVALAAAHLGRSDPAGALLVLEGAIAALRPTAKIDFNDHQALSLARALQAVALEAAGENGRAATLADELAREFRPDVLPGILARGIGQRIKE